MKLFCLQHIEEPSTTCKWIIRSEFGRSFSVTNHRTQNDRASITKNEVDNFNHIIESIFTKKFNTDIQNLRLIWKAAKTRIKN